MVQSSRCLQKKECAEKNVGSHNTTFQHPNTFRDLQVRIKKTKEKFQVAFRGDVNECYARSRLQDPTNYEANKNIIEMCGRCGKCDRQVSVLTYRRRPSKKPE